MEANIRWLYGLIEKPYSRYLEISGNVMLRLIIATLELGKLNTVLSNDSGYKVAIGMVLAAVLGIFVTAQNIIDDHTLELFIKEGGLVETLSAVGYFACLLLLAVKGGVRYIRKYWYFFVALCAFFFRELDFDKRFTEVGIFKSKFLFSPDDSLMVKIIGLSIVLFLLFTLITILRIYMVRFIKSIFPMTCFEFSICMAGVFMVVSKTLDGLARKLKGIVEISPEVSVMSGNMEEAMEFGIPCLFAIAILVYFDRQKRIERKP